MKKYYMTSNKINTWKKCKSSTIIAAKHECIKELYTHQDDELILAEYLEPGIYLKKWYYKNPTSRQS